MLFAALSSPGSRELLLLVDVPRATTGMLLLNLVGDYCLNTPKLTEIAPTYLVLWELIFAVISLLLRLDISVIMDVSQNFFALPHAPSLNNSHHLNHLLNEKLQNYTHLFLGNVKMV